MTTGVNHYEPTTQKPKRKGFRSRIHFISIAYKMAIAIATLLAISLGLVWLLTTLSIEKVLNEQAQQFGQSFAKQAADSAAEMILAEDKLALGVLVNNIIEDKTILEATVYSRDGTQLASASVLTDAKLTEKPVLSPSPNTTPADAKPNETTSEGAKTAKPDSQSDTSAQAPSTTETKQDVKATIPGLAAPQQQADKPPRQHISFLVDVRYKPKQLNIGYLRLTLDRKPLERPIKESLKKITIATLLIIGFSVAMAFYLGRLLARPVDKLVIAARKVAANNQDKIAYSSDDEFGLIIDTLNEMADGLTENSAKVNALSRLVPPTVLNALTEKKQNVNTGQYVNATVLFVDMVGFTALSEKLSPQAVATLLNRYFHLLNRVAKLYNGNIDKYIGDGAMVVFGAPQKDDEHCFHALCCASLFIALVQRLDDFYVGEKSVAFRVGIHKGDMIAGVMGSDEQMQYTVIGDTVNLASRLCTTAKENQVIITEAVLNEKDIRKRILVSDYQEVQLKGKSTTTNSYVLGGFTAPYSEIIQHQVDHLMKASLAS